MSLDYYVEIVVVLQVKMPLASDFNAEFLIFFFKFPFKLQFHKMGEKISLCTFGGKSAETFGYNIEYEGMRGRK